MNITVTFPDNNKKSYPVSTPVGEVIKDFTPGDPSIPVVGGFVNNEITSLSFRLDINCSVRPVLLSSRDGVSMYRRSLCFLVSIASRILFPEKRLVIGHSLGKGYFYHYEHQKNIPQKDLEALTEKMNELIRENLPIDQHHLSYQDAVSHFEKTREIDTALLLKYKNEMKIRVLECAGFLDLFHTPLVPQTGMLKYFEIYPYTPGFILRYPPFNNPTTIAPFIDNPLLFSIYKEYKQWGKILNIHCIGSLNEKIQTNQIQEFIDIAEALHHKKIVEIANRITENHDKLCVILIAGPSSSGKTTFAKRLSIQLKVNGLSPVPVSIDDYFLPRIQTPVDADGKPDFENISALDTKKLNDHLVRLQNGEQVDIPVYDFVAGKPKEKGVPLKLTDTSVLVLEGIHGLNDELTCMIQPAAKFKIYVSALTQLNLDDHNRIPTTDVRLIRRIVRDHQFRGHNALQTIRMWPSVRRGEDRNIFPFQNQAEMAFNSSLDYELAVLKVYVEPLLKTIKPDDMEYHEARRLLAFLDNVIPVPPTWIPGQSLLREFIGDSTFSY
ncbi:MAG: nucleoside kinase [Spirochaetales bacterium]|nr:nucleoside kinase [Spirochaetales bacterium]